MRIGIIGSVSFHAKQFAKSLNKDKALDATLSSIYDPDIAEAKKFADEYSVPHSTDSFDELIGNCDAVMITTRAAELHKEQAFRVIDAGLPVWVDKPFTECEKTATEIISYAKEKGVIVDGGTTIKRTKEFQDTKNLVLSLAPRDLSAIDFTFCGGPNDPNGGLKFYCTHLVEQCIEMFGDGYKSVSVNSTPRNTVSVVSYDTFDVYLRNIDDTYFLTCNIFKLSGNMSINFEQNTMFEDALKAFIDTINGKIPPISGETFIAYVRLMDMINKAFETGKTIKV